MSHESYRFCNGTSVNLCKLKSQKHDIILYLSRGQGEGGGGQRQKRISVRHYSVFGPGRVGGRGVYKLATAKTKSTSTQHERRV